MKPNEYKAAFDSVKFSENFERDTAARMRRAADSEKENVRMKPRFTMKTIVIAAAVTVILTASAFALTALLTAGQVAQRAGDPVLAQAFESEDALVINQTTQTGPYTITLAGIVSGSGLTAYSQEVEADKSYIVASVAYTDGRGISQSGETEITFSPLVSGYKPWQVNAWTLGGGYSAFVHEGVNYFLFECSNLEIFADHTVYLAAYEGGAPSADIFAMNEDGQIGYAAGFGKPHAMFTLPLDEKKADPDAAGALLDSAGVVIE